jgi:hypothetical protein
MRCRWTYRSLLTTRRLIPENTDLQSGPISLGAYIDVGSLSSSFVKLLVYLTMFPEFTMNMIVNEKFIDTEIVDAVVQVPYQ